MVFTNDNPRSEDPNQIMSDILIGVKLKNYEVIFDREEAIQKEIKKLLNNDILLILGKGHEDYQIVGTERIHFSDKEVALKYISE